MPRRSISVGRTLLYGGDASPLLRNLVSYWSLEEASGVRSDAYGTNPLTDNNTVTQAAGKVGSAGQFTAANSEYLSVASAALEAGDIDFHLTAWIYLDTEPAEAVVVSKWTSANNNEFTLEYLSSVDRMRAVVGNGSSSNTQDSNAFGAMSTATWYFVEMWHDAANNVLGVAVNGTGNTVATTIQPVVVSGAQFVIGSRSGGGSRYFDGRIDEVGYWKRMLTAAERAYLYNAGAGRSFAEIRAYKG